MAVSNRDRNLRSQLQATLRDWLQRADIGTDLPRILWIVMIALGLGLMMNAAVMLPQQSAKTAPKEPPPPEDVSLWRAHELVTEGNAVIVDVRSSPEYDREHIAGAISLPSKQVDAKYPDFADQVAKEHTVIVYCGSGCGLKTQVGKALLSHGYHDVRMMDEGIREWIKAGFPTGGKNSSRSGGEQ